MAMPTGVTWVFGKILGTFKIHFSHIEKAYGVYRAGKRDRTAVPGPLTHRFKVLKYPPKRKRKAIASLNRGHQYNRLLGIRPIQLGNHRTHSKDFRPFRKYRNLHSVHFCNRDNPNHSQDNGNVLPFLVLLTFNTVV
jgi:hypothetical protein